MSEENPELSGIQHADIIKNLHKSLREKVKCGGDPKQVWSDLLEDKQSLNEYSHSMHTLAKKHWEKDSAKCRVTWSQNNVQNYFREGGMIKVIKKCEKTKMFDELKKCSLEDDFEERKKVDESIDKLKLDMFWTPSCLDENKLLLMDVGSCFNPFKEFEGFEVIAVDISPATDDVLYCDFLNLNILDVDTCQRDEEEQKPLADELTQSAKMSLQSGRAAIGFFDVIVFSLLLSYFPTPSQRFQCCLNAHKSLKMHGLLVIITPDSSHQNKHTDMMKSWRSALQAIGFTRYKYEKLEHLHCMAYWKSSDLESVDNAFSDYMYIPQDKQSNNNED